MSSLIRLPRRVLPALIAFVGAWLMLVGVSAASPSPPNRHRPAPAVVLDGIAVDHLPAGLGTPSDFTYDYDDVDFVSRTWESARPGGGYRVDLDLVVMRGTRLTDGRALHDWFVAYQERPTGEARYVPVRVHGHPGWLARDQLFWLERPGLAVSVLLDGSRWSTVEVARTGWSAHEVSR